MLRKLYMPVVSWLLSPTGGQFRTEKQYYRDRAIQNAICMAVITIGARLFGWSHGVMAGYGFVADVMFNIIAGVIVLHLIDRARPTIYV